MKDNAVHPGEDIWITKVSVSYCSAMREMHSGERSTGSNLELSIPCRELSHCEAATVYSLHVFPIIHCPVPSVSVVILRSPGRFLFCVSILPQEMVFRLRRIFCAKVGRGRYWGTSLGRCAWDKHGAPGPQPTLVPQHSEWMNPFCFGATWPSPEAEYLFSLWRPSRPMYSSVILMQDSKKDPKNLFLDSYHPQ